jgi:hypothetical protein
MDDFGRRLQKAALPTEDPAEIYADRLQATRFHRCELLGTHPEAFPAWPSPAGKASPLSWRQILHPNPSAIRLKDLFKPANLRNHLFWAISLSEFRKERFLGQCRMELKATRPADEDIRPI